MKTAVILGLIFLASCRAFPSREDIFKPDGVFQTLGKFGEGYAGDVAEFVDDAKNEGMSLKEMKGRIDELRVEYQAIAELLEDVKIIVKDMGSKIRVDINADLVSESIDEVLEDVKEDLTADDIFVLILQPQGGLEGDGVRLEAALTALSLLGQQLNSTVYKDLKTVTTVEQIQPAVEILHAKLWAIVQVMQNVLDVAKDAEDRVTELQKTGILPSQEQIQAILDHQGQPEKDESHEKVSGNGKVHPRNKRQTSSRGLSLGRNWSFGKDGITWRRDPWSVSVGGSLDPFGLNGRVSYTGRNWSIYGTGSWSSGGGWGAGVGVSWTFGKK